MTTLRWGSGSTNISPAHVTASKHECGSAVTPLQQQSTMGSNAVDAFCDCVRALQAPTPNLKLAADHADNARAIDPVSSVFGHLRRYLRQRISSSQPDSTNVYVDSAAFNVFIQNGGNVGLVFNILIIANGAVRGCFLRIGKGIYKGR